MLGQVLCSDRYRCESNGLASRGFVGLSARRRVSQYGDRKPNVSIIRQSSFVLALKELEDRCETRYLIPAERIEIAT